MLRKKYYYYDDAETAYKLQLREARTGATLTEEKRKVLGKLLESGLERGQSIHHMMVFRKDEFQVSERSVYRYVNLGLFSQHPGRAELPKAPGMRPRRKKGRELKIDSKCRIGRSLADFELYCHQHHNPRRIALAERLLRCTSLNVREISRRCGFPEESSFCRFFQTRNHMTPVQFRQQNNNRRADKEESADFES